MKIYENIAERMLEALQNKDNAQALIQRQHNDIIESLYKEKELEQLKNEIMSDVLNQISFKLEATALKELKAIIDSLGKGGVK